MTVNTSIKVVFYKKKKDAVSFKNLARPAGMRVLLVDQWIETGGTMKAAIQLVERLGATVAGQARCFYGTTP